MFKEETIQKVNHIIREFFEKLGIEGEIEIKNPRGEGNTFFVKIETDYPQPLIGERGQTLAMVQRLLKAILRKQVQEGFYIDVDVNKYKEKKIKYLKELARSVSNEVALEKKEKILDPMPAYERRIIHLELAERSDVTTESVGREPYRRVVIKPYP